MIFGINAKSDISKLLYIISRAVRRVKFGPILKYHEWYLCQISRKSYAIIFVELFRFVGEKIGLKLLFGPAGPDIEQETEISLLKMYAFFVQKMSHFKLKLACFGRETTRKSFFFF